MTEKAQELRLKLGGVYKNRRGEEKKMLSYNKNRIPWVYIDEAGRSYKKNGSCLAIDFFSDFDLVEEIINRDIIYNT